MALMCYSSRIMFQYLYWINAKNDFMYVFRFNYITYSFYIIIKCIDLIRMVKASIKC